MTHFDGTVAAHYDEDSSNRFNPAVLDPEVDFLAALAAPAAPAGTGRALELAVGTGRVALPLSRRGVEVHGIEISPDMVERLRAKPGAELVTVHIGDMATVRVDGSFDLVYLVYNTITNLLDQDRQVDCFTNAATHLRPGGHFVIETFVPALRRLPPGERFVPFEVGPDRIGVDEYDVVGQRLTSHHHRLSDRGAGVFRSEHRYAWPAEYDLMARLAGLEPAGRWADWNRNPFTADSGSHVSVWRRPT